jgi:anti-sigma regulatory factor (Ser/Thr protein kinase)
VSSGLSPLTVETVRFDADLHVVAVSGELSTSSAGFLGKRLTKLLAATQRVLVDLSGLRLTFAPAAQVFPAVLAAIGGWPEVRLVMFGARPELATALDALRVTLQVPLAPDESDARLLVDRRPPVVSRILELERAPSAARRGRLFVEAACAAWQLDLVRDDAMAVASELVANAVVHAGTSCRLVLRCRERGLTIAVYDGRPDLVLPLRAVVEGGQGHGLFLVAALSLHWGARVGHDEKCVWAFLPATASVTYSHTVRKAAYDAVRVALTHGADSPGATALRQHVARLAEEHGLAFVRHVADELVAELAEATSAILPEEH